MIHLQHRVVYVVASVLVLATLLAPLITVSSPIDAAASSTFDVSTRAALDKALDEGFTASGMPGVTVGVWIPGKASWVASRGGEAADG